MVPSGTVGENAKAGKELLPQIQTGGIVCRSGIHRPNRPVHQRSGKAARHRFGCDQIGRGQARFCAGSQAVGSQRVSAVVEPDLGRVGRFRRLVRDYERLPETLAGIHFVVFAGLMLSRVVR